MLCLRHFTSSKHPLRISCYSDVSHLNMYTMFERAVFPVVACIFVI